MKTLQALIDPTAKLSISRQGILVGIRRDSVYDKPRPVSDAVLKLMHRSDRLHMELPFAGSRQLQGLLRQASCKVRRGACCQADDAHKLRPDGEERPCTPDDFCSPIREAPESARRWRAFERFPGRAFKKYIGCPANFAFTEQFASAYPSVRQFNTVEKSLGLICFNISFRLN